MSRGQTPSAELWCLKQRCSRRVRGVLLLAEPPGVCHCQSLYHRFSLLDTFALCTDVQGITYLCEAGFSVLLSHQIASLLVHSVFQPAVIKNTLKRVPSMCDKWFI